MRHLMHHGWEHLVGAVDRMNAFKVAAWGGGGSVVSGAVATVPDFTQVNAYADMIYKVGAAAGVTLSIGLIVLKIVLEWRHRDRPRN